MRAKRAVVLAAMLVFLALAVTLSVLAVPSGDEPAIVASQGGAQPVTAPSLDSGAAAESTHEGADAGIPTFILWIGATVSASGAVVTFMVFRVEVSKEKAAIRARKNRADYYKDLRKYNEQLKGPPQDNT